MKKLFAATIIGALTLSSISVFAAPMQGQMGMQGGQMAPMQGQMQMQPNEEFTSLLEEAGVDLETFKDLTKEEQAVILEELGIELPEVSEMSERPEMGERPEMSERSEMGERPEMSERSEMDERPERGEDGEGMHGGQMQPNEEFASLLEEAGVDLETFKDLTKEEQAVILEELGIELPEVPEMTERPAMGEIPAMGEKGMRRMPQEAEVPAV